MDAYLPLKLVHVLPAIFAVGANLTYGMRLAVAAGDRGRTAFALQGIRTIDRTERRLHAQRERPHPPGRRATPHRAAVACLSVQ